MIAAPKLVYCPHMDADIYGGTCAMCNPPARPRIPRDRQEQTVARFPGWCEMCEKPIEPGEGIAAVEEGYWSHYDCIEWDEP